MASGNFTYRLLSAAGSGDLTSVTTLPTLVYRVIGHNAAATLRYLKLYNLDGAPIIGVGVPLWTLPLEPIGGFAFDLEGFLFSTGLAFSITTGGADSDTTGATAADILAMTLAYGYSS